MLSINNFTTIYMNNLPGYKRGIIRSQKERRSHDFLGCEAIPLEDRAQAGAQIADSWNLPAKLPADAQARIAKVCTESRDALVQRKTAAGCQ